MSEFAAGHADDAEIRHTISDVYQDHGYLLDPHTATAWHVGAATRTNRPQVVVATAHPAKFADTITASLGRSFDWPEINDDLLQSEERIVVIEPETSELEPLIR